MSKSERLEGCRRELDDALEQFDRAEGPKDLLAAARAVRASTEALEQVAILQARAEGVSWSKIGAVYGLTKQGAQQRFRPRTPVIVPDEAVPVPAEVEQDAAEHGH